MLELSSGIVGTFIGMRHDPLQIGMLLLVFYAGAMAPKLWQIVMAPIFASMPFLFFALLNSQADDFQRPVTYYVFVIGAFFLPLVPGLLFRRIFRIRNDPH